MFIYKLGIPLLICLQLIYNDVVINSHLDIYLRRQRRKVTTDEKENTNSTNSESRAKCKCGLSGEDLKLRIMGGVDAKKHEFPWQALLTSHTGVPFCGGILINSLYILTAAHCIHSRNAADIHVRLGEHDLFNSEETGNMVLNANEFIIYKGYDKEKRHSDIALIKLQESVEFDANIRPPCFPRIGLNYTDKMAVIAGWGAQQERGRLTPVLQKVSLPIRSDLECGKYLKDFTATHSVLCAGYPQGGKDACQGDSGGPMMLFSSGKYFLIGIVSWGLGCGRPNTPGVYTRLDRYFTWIQNNSKGAIFC